MRKRMLSFSVACLVAFCAVFGGVGVKEVAAASNSAYLGLGGVTNFREGPGKDETGTPIYSFNFTFVVALFDSQGKIVDVETDILEISTPNYDGASMPHFTGWPTTSGYNTYDHNAKKITSPVEVTADFAAAELDTWKTKRERGDSYGMSVDNDWYKQMDFFEDWFKGKTVDEIRSWIAKNGTAVGRPIKLDTTNEADIAKLALLSDAEKAELADVLSGATMSLEDPHGLIVTAMEKAYQNRVPIDGAKIASLGLGTDKIFRNGPGADRYSFNITTTGTAFDKDGKIVGTETDILEVITTNYEGGTPKFSNWPGVAPFGAVAEVSESSSVKHTVVSGDALFKIARRYNTTIEDIVALNPQIKNKNLIFPGDVLAVSGSEVMDSPAVSVDEAKALVNSWITKRERGDAYAMNPQNEWYQQMDFFQSWMEGKTVDEISSWFNKFTTAAGRPIKADTTNEADIAKLASFSAAEKAELADVVSGATMSLEDPHGRMLTSLKDSYANAKAVQ